MHALQCSKMNFFFLSIKLKTYYIKQKREDPCSKINLNRGKFQKHIAGFRDKSQTSTKK